MYRLCTLFGTRFPSASSLKRKPVSSSPSRRSTRIRRQQRLCARLDGRLHARRHRDFDRLPILAAVEMNVRDVFARRQATAVRDLVVEVRRIAKPPKVVAQQVEDRAALVRVADRHIAGRLDPEIDVGLVTFRPADLDDNVAGCGDTLDCGRLHRRIEMRQQENHDRDEAAQRQRDDVAEHGSAVFVA